MTIVDPDAFSLRRPFAVPGLFFRDESGVLTRFADGLYTKDGERCNSIGAPISRCIFFLRSWVPGVHTHLLATWHRKLDCS